VQTLQSNRLGSRKREDHLSKDGKWRSFPKVPHLLQYVSSGNYFGKVKIKRKTIRQSLETTVWSTAQLKLNDFLKEQRENRNKVEPPKFSEAVELFKRELEHDTTLKPQSKKYRLWCLGKLKKTWPELWDLRLGEITPQACKEWASKLIKEIACHYYNNTLGTLKQVLQTGIKAHKANGGGTLESPAAEIKKTRIKQKELRLPEPSQFKDLVANIRKRSGGWGPRDGDLVEFLAYGGMRIKSEAVWVTGEDIDWPRKEIIVRGDPVTATKNSETRRVPILPDMENLLNRMKEKLGSFGKEPILQVGKCNEALARACKEIGIPMSNHGKQPYRLLVKSSTGFVAVKNNSNKVEIYPADGRGKIVIPVAERIVLWPCIQEGRTHKDREPETVGEIVKLDCSNNNLTAIGGFELQSLKELNCSYNLLQNLMVFRPSGSLWRGARDIEFLDCSHNMILNLDLSECSHLQRVDCSHNQLRSIRLGKNLKRLKSLDCSKNYLPLIDLAGLVALQSLNAIDNSIGPETP